jgi:hypothetical protein
MDDPGVHVAVMLPTGSDSLLITVFCVRGFIQEERFGLLEGVRDIGTQPYGWSRRGFLGLKWRRLSLRRLVFGGSHVLSSFVSVQDFLVRNIVSKGGREVWDLWCLRGKYKLWI